jgi:tRNA dimethylallyltransferase
MNKLLVICGPTATGKTNLAVQLARKYNGEIISADSRQVYRGMDIGTGKDIPSKSKFQTQHLKLKATNYNIGFRLKEGIPVWLVDLLPPNQSFNAALFVQFASPVIKDIQSRQKLPIIVGGTGFYLRSLFEGIDSIGVEPDLKLRSELETKDLAKLQNELFKLSPGRFEQMNRSDVNNPRRLIRAIEIIKQQQKLSPQKSPSNALADSNVLIIGLTGSIEYLTQRISCRVQERVEQGIVSEVKSLLKQGYGWKNSVMGTTIGYYEWQPYINGETGLEETVNQWQKDEINYAKRQITWFKKNKHIIWFDVSRPDFQKHVAKIVLKWYDIRNG